MYTKSDIEIEEKLFESRHQIDDAHLENETNEIWFETAKTDEGNQENDYLDEFDQPENDEPIEEQHKINTIETVSLDITNILPTRIEQVNIAQQQQITQQFFDMSCEKCDAQFATFFAALEHYELRHAPRKGFVQCCGYKYFKRIDFNDHIIFHLNPEAFK